MSNDLPEVHDDPSQAVELEARDHVWDILTDPGERPDPDCATCQAAVSLGIWAELGYPDPFTDEDDEG